MTITLRDLTKFGAGLAAGLAAPAIWTSARAQNQPIRVGCTVSQTGALASTKNSLIGYELWRDDVNAQGGLLGRKVELVVYEGEGHGFRMASTIIDSLERELAHYRRALDLDGG